MLTDGRTQRSTIGLQWRSLCGDNHAFSNDTYLQPYPQLATFLAGHPEVAHNPSYFFDSQFRELSRRQYDYNDPKVAAIRAIRPRKKSR